MLLRTVVFLGALVQAAPTPTVTLPSQPLRFGAFTARFDPAGTFTRRGPGLAEVRRHLDDRRAPRSSCGRRRRRRSARQPARYRVAAADGHPTFALIADPCQTRRMILDRSSWRLASETVAVAPRQITVTPLARPPAKPFAPADGQLAVVPRRRRRAGVADGQQPAGHAGTAKTGENILWRTPIPGLAHSSPIVWGDRVFVTSAVSSRSERDVQARTLRRRRRVGRSLAAALDDLRARQADRQDAAGSASRTKGAPRDKRHIKSTYASATPATDGRIVVAWFGSQGVLRLRRRRHAAVEGRPRPPRRRRLRHPDVRVGAGQLADHLERPGHPAVRHAGRFVPARAERRDRRDGVEDRARRAAVVGHADGGDDVAGPELVTNASNFIRGYDPRTGKELWRLGGSSKITAPTPIFADGLFVVASGRAPERPIFVVTARRARRPDAARRPDQQRRRSPGADRPRLVHADAARLQRACSTCSRNNGVFDAYDLKTGEEIYRQRLPDVGSGFSASPVAADGKIYLSNEDGEMLVVAAGPSSSTSRPTRWASC